MGLAEWIGKGSRHEIDSVNDAQPITSWHLQPIFDSYLIVLILGGLLALGLWMRPAFEGNTSRRQRILTGIRAVVIGLVIVGLLRPTRVHTKSHNEPSQMVVLLDSSRSMQVPDGPNGRTRWDTARRLVDGSLSQFREMQQNWNVEFFTFDSDLRSQSLLVTGESLPDLANGDESDLAGAIHSVVRRASGQRLGAVILVSDGSHRVLQPRVELQRSAADLGRRGCPLYAIPLGAGRESSQSRDVAVLNLQDHYQVFVKNELSVRAMVRIQGLVNQDLPVEMVITDARGSSEVVDTEMLNVSRDGQSVAVDLSYAPPSPGAFKLTVRVPEQFGEMLTDNNHLDAFLTVSEGGLRVMLLGNVFSQESKFLRWAIDGSPDMDLDFQWVPTRLRRQKRTFALEKLLEEVDYDVFVLSDVDASLLGEENCQLLADAVTDGSGLMMTGGHYSFGPGGYRNTPLAKVLPIKMGRFERQHFGDPIREDVHLLGELETIPTRTHFITHLASGDENAVVWNALPRLQDSNRFAAIQDLNAEVLAETQDGDPLLVSGLYDRGRTLAWAADSTFRWYRRGYKAQHQRFWRQAILWLAHKEDSIRDDVWVELEQRRLRPGATVGFNCGVHNADGDPVPDARVSAKLALPGGKIVDLPLGQEDQGWTGTLMEITEPGDYEIEVTAIQDGNELGQAHARFMVTDEDLELTDPVASPQQMEMLAGLTREVGGRVVPHEELPELLNELASQPATTIVQQRSKWQLADTLLDASLFFVLLVGLMTTEWFLRKRWGMV